MGRVEGFWDWLFGSGSSEPEENYSGGAFEEVDLGGLESANRGNFIKHREYTFFGAYEEMDALQMQWESAYHSYTNALIDGDRAQIDDLWTCMIEIDQDAAVLICQIEEYEKGAV